MLWLLVNSKSKEESVEDLNQLAWVFSPQPNFWWLIHKSPKNSKCLLPSTERPLSFKVSEMLDTLQANILQAKAAS